MQEINFKSPFITSRSKVISHLIGVSMVSIFLPIKIYPVVFAVCLLMMLYRISLKFYVFSFFAALILLLIVFTSTYTIQDDDTVTAIIKSTLGISFLIISSIFSYEK
ncbi:O-antigen ligase domain-containing protein, partial [Salmonella enterica subsp. enterica]|nr:O-antigen ligase domain-containing protein [Salmonella enterica subsp. enterica]